MTRPELVAIGASWGGIDALRDILGALPASLPVAIVVAQHRGRDDGDGLVELLARASRLPVSEPEDKEPILPGRVYLAPADYHLLVDRRAFALSTETLVNFARPSIDVLFDSAAFSFGERVMAVILSGAGKDGSFGLKRVKECGGLTAVQDPETAQTRGMPDAAIAAAVPDRILTLPRIAELILTSCVGGARRQPHLA
jgi:two-component system, chemotaxis family, protein-glutamate methylesterase/glutaminase